MCCVETSEFIKLPKLLPFEALQAEGKLVKWHPSMRGVFFLSHVWTSDEHPDFTRDQLRAFRDLLMRMLRGACPETAPSFEHAIQLPSDIKIRTGEWAEIVQDAYVWMDYLSVRVARAMLCRAYHGVPLLTRVRVCDPFSPRAYDTDATSAS